jgi:hypothetical protein
MSLNYGDGETPLSATALGILITAATMSGGISIDSMSIRLNSSRKVIQDGFSELRDFDLVKTSTSTYGGRHVSQTNLTGLGHVVMLDYLTGLKKAYWDHGAKS